MRSIPKTSILHPHVHFSMESPYLTHEGINFFICHSEEHSNTTSSFSEPPACKMSPISERATCFYINNRIVILPQNIA